jgi:hypothetical protein
MLGDIGQISQSDVKTRQLEMLDEVKKVKRELDDVKKMNQFVTEKSMCIFF